MRCDYDTCTKARIYNTPYCYDHLAVVKDELAAQELGMKFSDHKIGGFHLIPVQPLIELANVYSHGASKYAPWNWFKGRLFSDYLDSAERHMMKFMSGEDRDPDTGKHRCHHLAQVVFAMFAIMLFQAMGRKELDDRGPVQPCDFIQYTPDDV